MCGINCIVNGTDIEKMNMTLYHRGPDSNRVYTNGNISLGFCRLKIIDLSENGMQPFYSNNGNIVSICNGEIYNFRELKEELISDGIKFISDCDSEVIPELYLKYGLDFVKKLNGMFAIVIYDSIKNKVISIRDRIGVKPLYYYWDSKTLIISSEIKAIKEVKSLSINPEFIPYYLFYQYIPRDLTPYKNVYRALPSEMIIWENGILNRFFYWNAEQQPSNDPTFLGNLKKVEELLEDSVKIRLESDVPIGVYLSGGVDSSLIAYYAKKYNKNILGFHVKMGEEDYAREFAKYIGIKYEECEIDFNSFKIEDIIYHMDEPSGDSAIISNYLINREAKKHTTVMLAGLGGDELFGGYGRYLRGYSTKLSDQIQFFNRHDIEHIVGYHCNPAKMMNSIENMFTGFDRYNQMMTTDVRIFLPDQLLMLTDKTSMAHSMEVRTPFLDYRLVQYALNIDWSWKIPNGGKFILKEILGKIYNDRFAYRPKQGFGVDLKDYIEKNNIESQVLNSQYLKNFMNVSYFKITLDKSDNLYYNKLWLLYILHIWLEIN